MEEIMGFGLFKTDIPEYQIVKYIMFESRMYIYKKTMISYHANYKKNWKVDTSNK